VIVLEEDGTLMVVFRVSFPVIAAHQITTCCQDHPGFSVEVREIPIAIKTEHTIFCDFKRLMEK
jgi:hypothetical protein